MCKDCEKGYFCGGGKYTATPGRRVDRDDFCSCSAGLAFVLPAWLIFFVRSMQSKQWTSFCGFPLASKVR